MARLRQYFANRYASAEATNAEFENIIRYLNGGELGNRTLKELLDKLFNDDGEVDLGIEFRFNAATGLEVMTDPVAQNWELIVPAADLRGASGVNVGSVESPLISNRVDATAGLAQTEYPYTLTAGAAEVIVWVNGVLQAEAAYTYSAVDELLTFGQAPAQNALVTIASIRTSPVSAYRRSDQLAIANQITFPFGHEASEDIIVFRNGIFQREGGGYDYIHSSDLGTVTMTSAQTENTLITIICTANSSLTDLIGLMLEDRYTSQGFIRLDRIAIADGAIAQAKVSGLVSDLASKAKVTVSASTPSGPATGDFWVNTSTAIPSLLFWDGIRWLSASPNGLVPLPLAANALQFLRLNAAATALEYAPVDTSGLVALASVGLANGVASLNSNAKIPTTQLPFFSMQNPIIGRLSGSITNATWSVGIIANAKHTFDGLTAKLGAGTCTLQLYVNGVSVGSTLAVTTAAARLAISNIVKDATASPMEVALVVTGASGASDLVFNIGSSISD